MFIQKLLDLGLTLHQTDLLTGTLLGDGNLQTYTDRKN